MTKTADTAPWKATVLTLFPDAFPGPLGVSVIGSALKDEKWSLEAIDIREFSGNKHRSVDAAPAGGGAGMVLMPDVSAKAIDAQARIHNGQTRPLIYLTPRGAPLTQKRVKELASGSGVVLFCGRFEALMKGSLRGAKWKKSLLAILYSRAERWQGRL